ncbi:ATP-binding protein [Patescibacteria group bacterium]|nr:ATP-binding protein [Patescibacteria group bacterium]
MISRKITKEILQLKKEFPIVTILGPRQSGKTTLVQDIFKTYKYVSFEDPDIRELVKDDPRGFLKEYDKNVIIDEVQRVPEFFSYLQTHVDNIKKNGSFILTGSHNYLLMESISQSLAGRTGIVTLLPLSMEELPKENISNLNKAIFTGFYPRIFDQSIRPSSFYKSYVNTYIERDIRMIKNISSYSSFLRFLKLIAGRCGQVLNIKTIAEDSGISYHTAENWISILETSYIIFKLQPYYKNFNKRIIKSPKIFFYDTGLLSYLLGIRKEDELTNHYLKGNIFENFIVSDIIKYDYNRGNLANFYFWQDSNANKVDLIIDNGQDVTAIEIKAGSTIRSELFKNLVSWRELQDNKKQSEFLFYAGDMNISRKGVKVLNWKDLAKIKNLQLF